MAVNLKINGTMHSVPAEPDTPLLYVLRNDLGLNGAKFGCGLEQCGACTVLVDGTPTRACVHAISEVGTPAKPASSSCDMSMSARAAQWRLARTGVEFMGVGSGLA